MKSRKTYKHSNKRKTSRKRFLNRRPRTKRQIQLRNNSRKIKRGGGEGDKGGKGEIEMTTFEKIVPNDDMTEQLFEKVKSGVCTNCKSLIKQGANVNAIDNNGITPLMHASSGAKRNIETCKLLIENGANVNARSDYGFTPLFFATIGPFNFEICKLLIETGADINAKLENGETPLLRTIIQHDYNMFKFLIENGANVNVKNNHGDTPLLRAIIHDDYNMFKFLIDNGADVNAENNDGHTPLFIAIVKDDDNMCKFLIENGADVNAINNYDATPLITAIMKDNYNYYMCKFLIENGADVNARNNSGTTPLLVAASKNYPGLCELLIENGADVNVTDINGTTFTDYAKRFHFYDYIQEFISNYNWNRRKAFITMLGENGYIITEEQQNKIKDMKEDEYKEYVQNSIKYDKVLANKDIVKKITSYI